MKNKCTDVIDRDKDTSPSKKGKSSLLSWTRVLIWERDLSKSKIETSGL
jgi:hypothetical protein